MDRAYEGDETRQMIFDLELEPLAPPKMNRLNPWEYDLELYQRRNEVERLFRRLKGFRRIFSRFEKLDAMFTAFIHIALIFDAPIFRTASRTHCKSLLRQIQAQARWRKASYMKA